MSTQPKTQEDTRAAFNELMQKYLPDRNEKDETGLNELLWQTWDLLTDDTNKVSWQSGNCA